MTGRQVRDRSNIDGHPIEHATEQGEGKPWKYLLVPHDVVNDAQTLKG